MEERKRRRRKAEIGGSRDGIKEWTEKVDGEAEVSRGHRLGLVLIVKERRIEVLDEESGDDEEGGSQRKYKLPMSHIMPFPKRSDPTSAQDFGLGKQVLALLHCIGQLLPCNGSYVLEFDDDDEEDGSLPQRLVPFHWVVGLPGHKQ